MTREDKLIQRIKQNDAAAAEELAAIYYADILRYCIWHAPNRWMAEDAAQETFLKAFRYFDRYMHKGRWKPFLYQIAANTCIDLQRKSGTPIMSAGELPADIACTEPGFEEAQEALAFQQLIKALPEDAQELVLLRYGQELTLREIAAVVNLPLRTVQSRLRTALKRIKKDLEEKGGLP